MAVCNRTSANGMSKVTISQMSMSLMLGVLGSEFKLAMNRVVSISMPVRFTLTTEWKCFS